MSITLLEFVVAGVLLVVAWQIGIIVTPWIIQNIRGLKHELDQVAEEIEPEPTAAVSPNPKEEAGPQHNYRNN